MVKKSEESNSQMQNTSEHKKKKMTTKERDELLIENFVGIQRAMTNLSVKFESLSDNISRLLIVFEQAAKGFAEGTTQKDDKEFLTKINSLLEQNKTIAKGLVLMEEKLRNRNSPTQDQNPSFQKRPQPLPTI
jgi:hypothetical protein